MKKEIDCQIAIFKDLLHFSNQRNPVKTMVYDLSPIKLADIKKITTHIISK